MTHLFSLNKYFFRYKWHLILGFIFILLTNYFRILAPQITGYVVNTVVQSLSHKKTVVANPHYHEFSFVVFYLIQFFFTLSFSLKILYSGLILILLAIISGFFMFLMRQTIIVMSRLIEYEQKKDIYDHYQTLDISFFKSNSTGDLMNRISEDVSRVRMYTGPALMYFINLAAVIGFSVYFMAVSDLRLTLYALCPLPVLAVTIYFINSIINNKSEKIQERLSSLTSNAQESYSGIRVIKSFVQENDMISFFNANSEKYRKDALSLARTEAIYFPSMALLIGLSTLITIMMGGLDVVNHVEGATVGKIAEFVMYIQMLTWPVSLIGWTASMVQRAAASQKRINEFLHTVPSISNSPQAKQLNLLGNISFVNASFTYKNTGIVALKDFNLNIKKGDKVVIIGRTGSGKTTLAQLLLRMYDLDKGQLLFDNHEIKNIDLHSLRSGISYVPQDVFLFSDSIYNNICFGKPDANKEEVIAAAKKAGIYDEIMNFPQQFETILGERGITISGGQKQRISIARALIKNPELIIFDDCLSAVDAKTEQHILSNLYDYIQDKTSIIITHRVFSLLHFDKIVVLDHGRLAEIGNHDELIAQKGLYYDMYLKQQDADNE